MITYKIPFRVGEKVRVKTKEEFEIDYSITGTEKGFHVNCPCAFVEAMNRYCGEIFTICEIEGSGEKDEDKVSFKEKPSFQWSLSMVLRLEEPCSQLTLGVE